MYNFIFLNWVLLERTLDENSNAKVVCLGGSESTAEREEKGRKGMEGKWKLILPGKFRVRVKHIPKSFHQLQPVIVYVDVPFLNDRGV